ncbi:MAG: hypothetical protein AAF911_02510 [Planctomycetota bacterium]
MYNNKKFVDEVIDLLSESYPELAFEQFDSDSIVILKAADREECAVMGLAQIHERIESGQSIHDWLNDNQVKNLLEMFAGRMDVPEITPDSLILRLTHKNRLSREAPYPIHEEIFDDVWKCLCSHHDNFGAQYLHLNDLSNLNVSLDEAWRIAEKNTDIALKGTKFQSLADAEGNLSLILIDHVHASCALLVEPIRQLLAQHLGEPFLACIPATDEVLCMPSQPRLRADGYIQKAQQSFMDSAHPVSDKVFLVDTQGLKIES